MNEPISRKMQGSRWFHAQVREYTLHYGIEVLPKHPCGGWVIPPFQRSLVWTETQKIRFIESIWGGLPIGTYVFNLADTVSRYDYWLLDGQQRWDAISCYVRSEFPVLGYRYSDLTEVDHRAFLNNKFTAYQTNLTDEAALRDIFERLAYGGTPNVKQ